MLTSVWGPPMWHALHTISFNYPVNPSLQQKNVIENSLKIYNMYYKTNEKTTKKI